MKPSFSFLESSFRLWAKPFLVLAVLCAVLWFPACGDNNNPSPATTTTYKVYFNSTGGTAVDSQSVNSGSKATKPSNPTKTGFAFVGWYKDTTSSTVFNFDTETITASITLYAKWTANFYKVAFNSTGGTAVDTQLVSTGGKATKPADPTKVDSVLVAWYKEANLVNVFDFTKESVATNITLYAKWAVKQQNITTFNNYIKSNVLNTCLSCHGGNGGVTFTGTYADLKNQISIFNAAIQAGRMPQGSPFSATDRARIQAWVDNGAPEN